MGPCLCGDPYCPRCGNPEAAKLEAAQDDLLTRLAAFGITADEYAIVLEVGTAAVKSARDMIVRMNLHVPPPV